MTVNAWMKSLWRLRVRFSAKAACVAIWTPLVNTMCVSHNAHAIRHVLEYLSLMLQ
jgi:hypothetical protein